MKKINFDHWVNGYGVIHHNHETKQRIQEMYAYFKEHQIIGDNVPFYSLFAAADRIANAAMWLAVHQAYAKHVYLDGRELNQNDFKENPQGHLGGSLNMIPGYVGYMLINALTGLTRGWVMEQGHCVAAIDTVNLLLNNMTQYHAERYKFSDEGLTRFAQDFYSYSLNGKGKQDSPLGSHVNPHTAGGILEGGYLGFASLQYVHMPLPEERLVAFLSDGAFEEQRGSDWTPIWWRREDCGFIAPIMIANGRRIDQRATIKQEGCVGWFEKHLSLYDFDPISFDGRDPAAFAWSIWQQELRLALNTESDECKKAKVTRIPYGIAVAPKGAGFYNEGTAHAHNLPLVDNPSNNQKAVNTFNKYIKKLFVPASDLEEASNLFQQHAKSNRKKEQGNPFANRNIILETLPKFHYETSLKNAIIDYEYSYSAMDAIDHCFLELVKSNPQLRARAGNPDEFQSNRMIQTLDFLKFRVLKPESENSKEDRYGKIITTLNEEAIAAAAFGNKGGINIIVTYEAFATKMLGETRQEIIFAKHQKNIGRPARWLSVPIILTSNTWENGKNELSHQDPTFSETMLAETSDISRVVFPADHNTATAVMEHIYQTQGQIWTVITAKRSTPLIFSKSDAKYLAFNGAIRLSAFEYDTENAKISLIAIGAYQLLELIKVSDRLRSKKIPHTFSYLLEPGKFRKPRNIGEKEYVNNLSKTDILVPKNSTHIYVVTHTRPENMYGILNPLFQGRNIEIFGFINEGGTLDVDGMLYVNHCSWAHILNAIVSLQHLQEDELLTKVELQALSGQRSPDGIITKLKI